MDLRSTIGYEALKQDGISLFIRTMTEGDAEQKVSADIQTLLETAWNQKGQAGGAMMLCRLVGYVESLAGVVAGIHQAGVQFFPIEDENGRPISMRVVLHPEAKESEPEKPQKPASFADLDKLEGSAYEAALAKLTDAERKQYLETA